MTKKPTKPDSAPKVRALKARIASEPKVALAVFRAIWRAQKDEEQFTLRHQGHDGKGFRESESYTLNRFYEIVEGQNWLMTPAQMEFVMERAQPYAAQFLRNNAAETKEREAELAKERLAKPAAKVNKHPPRRKLSKEERERMWNFVSQMED